MVTISHGYIRHSRRWNYRLFSKLRITWFNVQKLIREIEHGHWPGTRLSHQSIYRFIEPAWRILRQNGEIAFQRFHFVVLQPFPVSLYDQPSFIFQYTVKSMYALRDNARVKAHTAFCRDIYMFYIFLSPPLPFVLFRICFSNTGISIASNLPCRMSSVLVKIFDITGFLLVIQSLNRPIAFRNPLRSSMSVIHGDWPCE